MAVNGCKYYEMAKMAGVTKMAGSSWSGWKWQEIAQMTRMLEMAGNVFQIGPAQPGLLV